MDKPFYKLVTFRLARNDYSGMGCCCGGGTGVPRCLRTLDEGELGFLPAGLPDDASDASEDFAWFHPLCMTGFKVLVPNDGRVGEVTEVLEIGNYGTHPLKGYGLTVEISEYIDVLFNVAVGEAALRNVWAY